MVFDMGRGVAALLTATLVLGLPAVALGHGDGARPGAAGQPAADGQPRDLRTRVVPGRKAIEVTWLPPSTGLSLVTGYEISVDGNAVDSVSSATRTYTISGGLQLGRTYEIGVRATLLILDGPKATTEQPLYIAPVTTRQERNPSNPLAGREWGVYLGQQDQAVIGWSLLGQDDRDRLSPIAMIHKAKFFGRWISDAAAEQKTREYVADTQAGDPSRLTVLTLFRMFPWEGDARIDQRLPTAAEQAAYRTYVSGVARGIGDDRVAVVLQPDGYFVKDAYDVFHEKLGRKRALLPARMLAWTAKTLSAGAHTTVYVDMGSEDWARGEVAPVAKFLRLSGVAHARGFALNVSHKNYLSREILFAKKVSRALAKMGIPGKHAVLDTSDNGQPFAGQEINPPGSPYTPPGEIDPCTKKNQATPCTALGVPPTTDVDNPLWGLPPTVARTAAKYVDAYLWVSRPWLPDQGRGETKFSPRFATLLLRTWDFSPFFVGTP